MNPLYIELIKSMAVTAASLYAQSQGRDLSGLLSIAPLIQAVTTAYNNSMSVVAQAQREGWTDDDVRWTGPFAEADAVLAEIEKRMT